MPDTNADKMETDPVMEEKVEESGASSPTLTFAGMNCRGYSITLFHALVLFPIIYSSIEERI